jgi:hypothetical protein
MGSLGAGLALAFALLATLAPAAVADPPDGQVVRGPGENDISVNLTNKGTGPDEFLQIEMPPDTTAVSVKPPSGATGGCTTATGGQNVLCDFSPPGYWPAGGQISIDIQTASRMPDNASVTVFVCRQPCTGSFSGPFTIRLVVAADLQVQMREEAANRAWGRPTIRRSP